jgi:UDPglucose 6-dehydrogenase
MGANVPTSIAVIGSGYLGTTHAVSMAELGYRVLAVDVDADKVERLQNGDAPFFEPQLSELLQRHTASGRLQFSTDFALAADFADVFFLCVGTPQRADALGADLQQVFAAVRTLTPLLTRSALLVGKSTVPVGTAHALAELASALAPPTVEVEVAWNPEFLREGCGVQDTLSPDRLVLGTSSARAEARLKEVYSRLLENGVPLVSTDTATAELVKCAANAFLATKISFINMVAELCEASGAHILPLAEALGYDDRIGPRFLHPGLGFGGGCLPKDLRALMVQADDLGVPHGTALLREVDQINLRCRARVVEAAVQECGGSVVGRRIAVLGLAFKPFTDDVRDSAALDVAQQLQAAGAHVQAYDPYAIAKAQRVAPALTFADGAEDALRGADLVLHLTDWPEFRNLDPARSALLVDERRIIDARNALNAEQWHSAGWVFRSLGTRHRQILGAEALGAV